MTGQWDGPGIEAWQPWTPVEVAGRLVNLDVEWCVVGGWSIELFVGTATRPHHDLEIATQRIHLPRLREHWAGFVFHVVGEGSSRRLGRDEPSPLDRHQHWVLDPVAQAWRVDVMIEPGDARWWVYRRDDRIRAPRSNMVATTADGIPYLMPHGALLYKAKHASAKDEVDLEAVLPRMERDARAWLAEALALVHPGHRWLERLA